MTQCLAITCGVFISRALPTQTKCQRHTGTSEWDSDVGVRVGDEVTEGGESSLSLSLSLSLSFSFSLSLSLAGSLSLALSLSLSLCVCVYGMYVCKCV